MTNMPDRIHHSSVFCNIRVWINTELDDNKNNS